MRRVRIMRPGDRLISWREVKVEVIGPAGRNVVIVPRRDGPADHGALAAEVEEQMRQQYPDMRVRAIGVYARTAVEKE